MFPTKLIQTFLRNLGYLGSVPQALNKYLADQGYTGHINEALYRFLGALGYVGSLPNRVASWILSGLLVNSWAAPATSRTTEFGVSMHSFLDTSIGHVPGALDTNGDVIPNHGGLLVPNYWQATVHSTFLPGSTEEARFSRNGPERTSAYTGPLWVAVFGDMAANRMWEVGSAEWTTQRSTLISYATEALAAGRSHMVIGGLWPGLAGATPANFLDVSQKQQLLRQEIETAVPGLNVFVFPSHLLVQYALNTYGSNVYGGDGFHLRLTTDPTPSQITVALSRMADMALTHEQWDTSGDNAELADLTTEAWNILTTYEFCGMGGTDELPLDPNATQMYFDETDAADGVVTTFVARGSGARSFTTTGTGTSADVTNGPSGYTFTGGKYLLNSDGLGAVLRQHSFQLVMAVTVNNIAAAPYLVNLGPASGNGRLQIQALANGRVRVQLRNAANTIIATHDAATIIQDGVPFILSVSLEDNLLSVDWGTGGVTSPISDEVTFNVSGANVAYDRVAIGALHANGSGSAKANMILKTIFVMELV